MQREEATDGGFARRPVLPVGHQCLHARAETNLVGVAVLEHESLDALWVTGRDPEADRRSEVEHVQAEAVQACGVDERVDRVRESIEGGSLLPETEAIDKNLFSCFGSDVFCTLLKRLPGNRNTLLLCGMESHICVMQTALAALREGYLVHVASDAVSSRTEWNWKIGLDRMRAAGAVISSTEMMIYELMRSSSSPAFKELLPHLKG